MNLYSIFKVESEPGKCSSCAQEIEIFACRSCGHSICSKVACAIKHGLSKLHKAGVEKINSQRVS